MRVTHWLCLFSGMCLGVVGGAGLIVLQLKYGSAPVISCDGTGQGEGVSAVAEPKAIAVEPDPEEEDPPSHLQVASVPQAEMIAAPRAADTDEPEMVAAPRADGETEPW